MALHESKAVPNSLRSTIIALGLVFSGGCVWAGETPLDDVQKGRAIAAHSCAACHFALQNQRTQPILDPPGPRFEQLALRGSLTPHALSVYLQTIHRDRSSGMGLLVPELHDDEVAEVAAYIMSLRAHR